MLMDLFYATLPPSLAKAKRRVHFHAFMDDVQLRSHKFAQTHPAGQDLIVPVARQLSREARVLCFDEFQVLDIVDAMILRRLLESMIGYGCVVIITSKSVASKSAIALQRLIISDIKSSTRRFIQERHSAKIIYTLHRFAQV